MIPIPVETLEVLAVLNLPKEMADNVIFKEHQGLVLETIRSLVLDNYLTTWSSCKDYQEPCTRPVCTVL